jgi:hypothetical protein
LPHLNISQAEVQCSQIVTFTNIPGHLQISHPQLDSDIDHYLVLAKVKERLAVNKQISHRFHMKRFNLKNLNKAEGKKQYSVEDKNKFTALEEVLPI